jgi:Leucine-rich repeat (LRR) protein
LEVGYISFNRLTSLDWLRSNDLSYLHELNLSNNRIELISDDTFLQFRNLFQLNISYNKLKEIGKNVFNGLISLNQLDLSNNLIEIINDEAFLGMELLKLDLSCNRIKYLRENSFKGLSKTWNINLSNNELEERSVKIATMKLFKLNEHLDYSNSKLYWNFN